MICRFTAIPADVKSRVAVFFDRDGVINDNSKPGGGFYTVKTPKDLVVYGEAIDGIVELTKKTDLLKILVTNQGCVEAGVVTENDVKNVHAKLLKEVRNAGGDIDAIYYSPYQSKNNPLTKPNPGMIHEAEKAFDINLDKSYMIGDQTTDIACGENADRDITSILVKTGHAGKDRKVRIEPDVVVEDFLHAADYIIADYNK